MPYTAHPVTPDSAPASAPVRRVSSIHRWWLISICVIIVSSAIAELIGLAVIAKDDTSIATTAALTVAQIGATAVMLRKARLGAALTVILAVASMLIPTAATFSMLFAVILAINILTFRRTAEGIAAVVVMVAASVISGILYHDSAMASGGALSLGVFCLIACTGGWLMRQWDDAQRRARRAERLEHDMAIAQYLHDYTTNDLNNILMLTDLALTQPDSPAPDTLERVRGLAKDALKQTRLAIAALEHDDDADEHTIYQPTASDLEQQLFAVAEEQRTLLGTYGYQGSVLIGEHPFAHCSQAQATLALSLVREMFSNIVQHADPAAGYTMTIAATPSQLHIAVTDCHAEHSTPGMNTGLARLRRRITEAGGTWQVEEHGRNWTLATIMPTE